MTAVQEIKLKIEGMHCISCVKNIENSLKTVKGIIDVKVDFATSYAFITFDPTKLDPQYILQSITKAGYQADWIRKEERETSTMIPPLFQNSYFLEFLVSALLTLPLMLGMFAADFSLSPWHQLILATLVQFWCARSFYRGAYFALKAKSFNMDVLIALGSSAAYFFSLYQVFAGNKHQHLYFETSAAIITIVLLGRWMEGSTKHQATLAIEKLLLLRPKKVQVERDELLMEIAPEEVMLNEIFYVRPGESVAVDGKILTGSTSVDESFLTGEALPVFKEAGDLVYAGTINQSGLLKAKALVVGDETRLSQIIQLVEKLHLSKAPIQRLADKVASYFVPSVLVIALLTFLFWWLGLNNLKEGILSAIAVLIIACPCALGIATPLVILIASGKAAENGFVFQDAAAFERAANIDTFIFDKTGTITEGKPQIKEVIPLGAMDKDEVAKIAASIGLFSEHPLAKSIVEYAKKMGFEREPVQDVESIPGKGFQGKKRGINYAIGSRKFAIEKGVEIPDIRANPIGATEIFLWREKECLGVILIQDAIKKDCKRVVDALKARGIEQYLISGDLLPNVEKIAHEVGIENYLAEVLPADKAKEVIRLKNEGRFLGMVGDGINDAPALAAADVGFSIGSGSDIAIHASDATLIHNNLMNLVDAIDLSKESIKKIKQNLFLAFAYNTLAIPLAAFGMISPIIAALAMVLSSISVVGNSLLLKRWTPKNR